MTSQADWSFLYNDIYMYLLDSLIPNVYTMHWPDAKVLHIRHRKFSLDLCTEVSAVF